MVLLPIIPVLRKVRTLLKTFSGPILMEPILIMIICSLTAAAPYYDCSEQWEISVYSNQYLGLIPCPTSNSGNLLGCANFVHNKIDLIQSGVNSKDECNRTILLHELLHMKYKDQTIHSSCRSW